MTARSDRMYKNSPKIGKDENGKAKLTKGDGKEQEASPAAAESDSSPAHARHAIDRMALHGKHEQEHFAHDHGKAGAKAELHKRHLKEVSDMMKRHEKEGK